MFIIISSMILLFHLMMCCWNSTLCSFCFNTLCIFRFKNCETNCTIGITANKCTITHNREEWWSHISILKFIYMNI
eukprot:UN09468